MAVDITRGFVSVASGQLHYRQVINPGKPSLVLLHQAPSSSTMFEPLMQALGEHYHIVAPDFPGFGDSEALAETPSVELYAQNVYAALQQLGVNECLLFGHHSGTSVAMALTEIAPLLASKMFLSGAALLTSELKQILPSKAEPIAPQADGRHVQAMWQRIAAKDIDADIALVEREVILALQMGEGYQQAYQAVADYDFAKGLAQLNCPLMICAGTEDPLYSLMDSVIAVKPETKKAEITDGRTYVCERNTAEIAELMHNFFSEV